MANSYILVNVPTGLVMDVRGASLDSGTAIQVSPQNSPVTPNQLWHFEAGPTPEYFYILSNLGNQLAIDIQGGKVEDRGKLQTSSPPRTDSQLWKAVGLAQSG
jgi:hypothetical protein